MANREPASPAGRRLRSSILGACLVVTAALAGVLGYQALTGPSSTAASPFDVVRRDGAGLGSTSPPRSSTAAPPIDGLAGAQRGGIGEADGVVPDGTTVFADVPGVTKLKPALLGALRRAAADAAAHGVEFYVNSGWRSPKYEDELRREAILKYGSEKAADRWVATAATSAHVSGDAVDVGRADATAWLASHGAAYGLCQIYRNEPWHYELRPDAVDDGCPPMYADPSQDPRMQR